MRGSEESDVAFRHFFSACANGCGDEVRAAVRRSSHPRSATEQAAGSGRACGASAQRQTVGRAAFPEDSGQIVGMMRQPLRPAIAMRERPATATTAGVTPSKRPSTLASPRPRTTRITSKTSTKTDDLLGRARRTGGDRSIAAWRVGGLARCHAGGAPSAVCGRRSPLASWPTLGQE